MEGTYTIKRGDTVLADDLRTGKLAVQGPDFSGEHQLDPVLRLFATKAEILDREGSVETLSFTISRTHATLAEALAFWGSHFRQVRGVADFVMELIQGSAHVTITAANAGWKSVRIPMPTGLSTETTYSLIIPELAVVDHTAEGLTGMDGEDLDLMSGGALESMAQ